MKSKRYSMAAICLILSTLLSTFQIGAQPLPTNEVKTPAPVKAPPLAARWALVGATIHTGSGEIIDDGVIVIEDGVIKDVGKALALQPSIPVISAKGMMVTPGLTDPLTSIGLIEVDLEPTTRDDQQGGRDIIRAGFRVRDGYNPASVVVGITRAEGVTSVGVIPTGGLISGQSAWVDLDGATANDAIVTSPLALHIHIDAESDIGGHATALLRVREALDDARTFVRTRAAWERNQSRPFAPSRLDLEALATVLSGKLPVVFHVDRASDILASLAVAREFKLRPVIAGGAEGWKVAKELAAAKAFVIVFPLLPGPVSFDALAARDDNAALLHAASVKVMISTGDTHNARKLRQVAGNAVRAGLPHSAALAAITNVPAEAFGMLDRYGTIAKGKVANLVVWSADPLEIATSVVRVIIRGKEVTLANRQTALFEKYRRSGTKAGLAAGSPSTRP